jgi:hypothetical protein
MIAKFKKNHRCKKMENKEKIFGVKFLVGKGIQTQIQMQNITSLEAIGLLEMAKDQIQTNFRNNTKNVFKMRK